MDDVLVIFGLFILVLLGVDHLFWDGAILQFFGEPFTRLTMTIGEFLG